MLTFLLWYWTPSPRNKYYTYSPARVNAMVEMLGKHYKAPHRVVCITDNPCGILCETRPLWDDLRDVAVARNMPPQSWARLKIFAPGMKEFIGAEDVVSVDLDSVILNDITDLFIPCTDYQTWGFKGWLARGYKAKPCIYNASLFMTKLEYHTFIWESFDPRKCPPMLKTNGYVGTEQAWQSFCLGRNMPVWSWREGVYSYRLQMESFLKRHGRASAPPDCRWVFMHGALKPWTCKDEWCIKAYPSYAR